MFDLATQLRGDAQRLLDLWPGQPGGLGELVLRRPTTELRLQPLRLTRQPLLPLDDVEWEPDGPGLRRDGALNRLPDPPARVGGEPVSAAPVELLGGPHQPERALLDQVEERKPASAKIARQATTRRKFDSIISCLAAASPRSIRFASATSSVGVSSRWLAACARKTPSESRSPDARPLSSLCSARNMIGKRSFHRSFRANVPR